MTTVLAALDSNASAKPVLTTAIALASLFDATVVVLHVRENAPSVAAELARASGLGFREVDGVPVQQIVAAAQDPDVDAIALGARGVHGGPQPAGHTALEVITRVEKPVVVVPPHAQPADHISRILVPLEGTSESSWALEDMIKVAERHALEIVVLHVYSPATVPAFADHAPYAARAWDEEFLSRYVPGPRDHITFQRRLGVPADDIAAVAREAGADLIALGWSQNLTSGHARVVSETLAHSTIPVLLSPARRAIVHRISTSPHAVSAPDPGAKSRAERLDGARR
jgi:nucleotide-binding universal stress UspA family protein